jgi:hypothetical protein
MRKLAVYMAGDNNLSDFCVKNIVQMEAIGSTPDLQIFVEAVLRGKGNAARYIIQKREGSVQGHINSANLAPKDFDVNTGDPNELYKFMTWALGNNPSQEEYLILWGHGSGWEPSGKGNDTTSYFNNIELMNSLGIHERIYKKKEASIWAILDDFAHGNAALDMIQLENILSKFRGSRPKFKFLGFDACLMSSIEIAYQIMQHSEFLIASESPEPSDGWPYHRVMKILSSSNEIKEENLRAIIDAYVESYIPGKGDAIADESVTISLIKLAKMPELIKCISSFSKIAVELLDRNYNKYYIAFTKAKSDAPCFERNSYIDLVRYMLNIKSMLHPSDDSDAKNFIDTIDKILSVINNTVYKKSIDSDPDHKISDHGGISIYFPPRHYDKNEPLRVAYEQLKIFKAMPEWWKFIFKLYDG